jgi:hypothetical protein
MRRVFSIFVLAFGLAAADVTVQPASGGGVVVWDGTNQLEVASPIVLRLGTYSFTVTNGTSWTNVDFLTGWDYRVTVGPSLLAVDRRRSPEWMARAGSALGFVAVFAGMFWRLMGTALKRSSTVDL